MKDILSRQYEYIKTFWAERTKKQKIFIISSLLSILFIAAGLAYMLNRTEMVPLYTNLKPAETGSIKESLDSKGIKSEIADNGKTIKVPEKQAETVMVELASEGIPKSGNIDYSFFSENASFGMTDNEFDVIKLDAMQNELAGLIESIEGIEQAKVMINMPEKSVFVKESQEKATASIILQTEPGYEFDQKQVKSLYHLVSKSVPNLPTENIVIRNQHLEYFDLDESTYADSGFDKQMQIKKQIERDIQRQVQEMLGTLMGYDKVMTSVTADIDFTQENREENLVTPVDEENMRGIAISAQRITETFSGGEGQAGGVPEASDPADAGTGQYLEGSVNEGESERNEETINYEVNKIRKEIVESPYKIRDLGIQVVVEPPEPNEQASLPQERIDDIREILSTIVRTSIDKGAAEEVSDEEIESKVVVSVQPFYGKAFKDGAEPESRLPWWAYVVLGVLIAVIAVLIFLWTRSMKSNGQEDAAGDREPIQGNQIGDINEPVLEKAPVAYRRQLEIMAKENPEQFAEILRTWLVEDEEA